jgi:hypothetical protein
MTPAYFVTIENTIFISSEMKMWSSVPTKLCSIFDKFVVFYLNQNLRACWISGVGVEVTLFHVPSVLMSPLLSLAVGMLRAGVGAEHYAL